MDGDGEIERYNEQDEPASYDGPGTDVIKLVVAGYEAIYIEIPSSYTEDERGAFQAGLFKGVGIGVTVVTGEEYRVVPQKLTTRDGD